MKNLPPADLRLFKFFLFSSQDFDFFRTPQFLGSEYLLMVALPYESTIAPSSHYLFAHLEIPHTQRSPDSTAVETEAIGQLAQNLKTKMDAGQECKAIFDLRSQPSDWTFEGRLSLKLKGEKPAEVLKAQKIAENFLLLKSGERKMLAGEIPWNTVEASAHTKALGKKALREFYDATHAAIAPIVSEHDRKKKLLLHVCCGPDAAGVVEQLKDEFDLTCFWYDPNIQPKSEYDLRLEAFLKVARIMQVEAVVGEYDAPHFLDKISGLEASPEQGAKCTICYDMRLERSVREAKAGNFDLFSTTLAISPHKVQQKLKLLGENLAKKFQIPYLARNFMKEDGFKDSVVFTEENDIYRQDYCGCWFSLHEGGPQARKMAEDFNLTEADLKTGNYTLPVE